MKCLVNKNNNQVNYGIYDEPLQYNWSDYKLKNFWDRNIRNKKRHFHKFFFISFINPKYVIALAFVDLGMMKNTFGYIYENNKGIVSEWQKPLLSKRHIFTNDFDHNLIKCNKHKLNINMQSDIEKGNLNGNLRYKNTIKLDYDIDFGFKQKPLRVVNPHDFEHWAFTQKRAGLKLNKLSVFFNNQKLDMTPNDTTALIDFSGGWFKRQTNWLWACGGVKINNDFIGFNFCIFNNDTLYPENAVWINNEREHFEHIIFEWDNKTKLNEIKIFTRDKRIDLSFKPFGEKTDIHSRGLGYIKTNFHQLFGNFSGYVSVNNKKIKLDPFLGLVEIHKSRW